MCVGEEGEEDESGGGDGGGLRLREETVGGKSEWRLTSLNLSLSCLGDAFRVHPCVRLFASLPGSAGLLPHAADCPRVQSWVVYLPLSELSS